MKGRTLVKFILIMTANQYVFCFMKMTLEYSSLWMDPSLITASKIINEILSGPLKEKSVTLLTEKDTDGGIQITNKITENMRTPLTLLRFPHQYPKHPSLQEQRRKELQIHNGTQEEMRHGFESSSKIDSLIIITTSDDELWWPFHSQSMFAKDLILISPWSTCLTKNFFETPLLSRISFVVHICRSKSLSLSGNGTAFRLWSWRPYAEANQLVNLGLWNPDSFRSWDAIFINRFHDMTKKNMLILVNPQGIPFIGNDTDGSVTGVSYKIMKAFSSVLHFNLTIEPSGYYLWEFLLKKLRAGENDLFVNVIYMTLEHYEEYDLLRPYIREGHGIMVKLPPPLPRWKNIIYPFSWIVWAAVVVSMICTSVVYHYLHYEYSKHFVSNALDVLQFVLSNAMAFVPKEWRIRIFLIVYWIASNFIHMSYTCNLIAVLTVPVFPKLLETAEDLANSNLRLCMLDYGSFVPGALKTSTNPVFSKLGHILDVKLINFTLELAGQEHCEDVLLQGTHAHIEANAYIHMVYKSRPHTAEVYPLKEQIYSSYVVFLAKKHTPWSYVIDRGMQRMIESGLIQKWHDDETKKSRKQFGTSTSGEPQPLSLDHLQGSFYLMIGGTIISVLTLAKEVVEASYFFSKLNDFS